MSKQTLETDLKRSLANLFKLVEKFCWNKLSQNCLYIISDFNEFDSPNHNEYCKTRKAVNRKKNPQDLHYAIHELEKEYSDLYDITLYVFRAKRNLTIIEIQYFRKSNLDQDHFATIKDSPPMFHTKISSPIYARDHDIKFDVNWESMNIRHNLNLLIHRWKYRR
jgi:hypothetical protein